MVSSILPDLHLIKQWSVLEQKRERGEIPSGIRETFLKDLLDEMRCICGRPIHDGSEEHNNLLNQLNQSVSSRLEDIVMETRSNLKHLLMPRVREVPVQLVDPDEAAAQAERRNRIKRRTYSGNQRSA